MKTQNYLALQGLWRYLQNWPQKASTKYLCKNIQETRAQPPCVMRDILGPCFGVNLGITMLKSEKDALKITDGKKKSLLMRNVELNLFSLSER